MTAPPASVSESATISQLGRIRRWNVIAGFAHLAQLFAILVLANDFTLPVTASYMAGPPGTPPSDPVVLFDTRIAWGVALFFGLSALFHFAVSLPPFNRRYVAGLVAQHNYFRWVEYSLSSSVMMVLIAQIVGISDAAALIAIFGVNASMILFGWLQERYETPGSGGWAPFVFGCIAGLVPWLAVGLYVIAPGSTSGAEPPAFVYGIVISLFVFFNSFALVQVLQYKRLGRWSNYLNGERTYITLSLVAKSLLAWQIFAGTLAPGS
ncbi:MAG: heliorhodopsin HeR [Actinomycetota bacterium]|nr:heliorhodopsin HeR [Actinomycetota bacterium]